MLDLQQAEGKARLHELCATADVIIEKCGQNAPAPTTHAWRCPCTHSSRAAAPHQSPGPSWLTEPPPAQCLTALACVRYNSYRPGVMARLGFGWEELHAAHPHLVMCSISGFGQVRPSLSNCPLDSSILPVFPWTFAVLPGILG